MIVTVRSRSPRARSGSLAIGAPNGWYDSSLFDADAAVQFPQVAALETAAVGCERRFQAGTSPRVPDPGRLRPLDWRAKTVAEAPDAVRQDRQGGDSGERMRMMGGQELGFRKANRSDVEWLLELRLETMASYLQRSGIELSADDQLARVTEDFCSISIITLAGADIGMIKVRRESNPWHLVQIQLLPDHQGKGIGRRIISDLVGEAQRQSASLELSVLKVNPAKHLYERLGFRVISESDHACEMRVDPAHGVNPPLHDAPHGS